MPNNALIDDVLSASASATPSERMVLKLAASLLKRIDPEYQIREDTDEPNLTKLHSLAAAWIHGCEVRS